MDPIDERLNEIEHLQTLSGQEYVAEAERLGFVVTERGVYLNPHHPANEPQSLDDGIEMIRRQFERHGVEWSAGPDSQRVACQLLSIGSKRLLVGGSLSLRR